MIYYKISFLIVLISVVCFSADIDPKEEERRINDCIDTCKDNLRAVFKNTRTSKTCVQTAIKKLKLFGKHADIYDCYVKMYYESFHKYIDLSSVILPESYCNYKGYMFYKPDCENELKIFKEVPSKEDSEVPVYGSPTVPFLSGSHAEASSSEPKKKKVKYSEPQGSNDENTEQMIVLKNALYYHVTFDPTKKNIPPEDEARKYFHADGSYGYSYLLEIANLIEVDTGKLRNRNAFCDSLHPKYRT